MEINRESLVGSWNVYFNATVSELELQANGRYLHTLWGGAQSHWGMWSIQQDGSFNVLRLDLQGAQPETHNGPYGPVQMQWPPYEAWVIQGVLPNQIAIYGGLLIRSFPAFPAIAPPMASEATQAPAVQPKSTNVTASASNPAGEALIAKVIEAAGGMDKLKAIRVLRTKSTVIERAQQITLQAEVTWVLPDKIHTMMNAPYAEIVWVVTPQDSFWIGKGSATGTEVKPMPPFMRDNLLHAMRRCLPYVAQHMSEFAFSAQGTEQLGSVEAQVLDVSGDAGQWRCHIDAQKGHILRTQCQAAGETDPATVVVNFSDWKLVNGLTFPFQSDSTSNGQPAESAVVSSFEFNPAVDPGIFARPQNMAASQQPSRVSAPAAGQPVAQPQYAPAPAMHAAPALPPLPMPNPQFANIMKQWADLHQSMMQSARDANIASSKASHDFAKQFIAYARS